METAPPRLGSSGQCRELVLFVTHDEVLNAGSRVLATIVSPFARSPVGSRTSR